jgi:hypothetical protein
MFMRIERTLRSTILASPERDVRANHRRRARWTETP